MNAEDQTSKPFPSGSLPVELADNLRTINPWWFGKPGVPMPAFHRWPFARLKQLLTQGIAPATVLRGPRRVGKTILLRQVLEDLLLHGMAPSRVLYVPFDELATLAKMTEPILQVARWFESEVLHASFNEAARRNEPAFLFFDEVQNLEDWAPQLKNLVDNHAVRVLVTGSSSLQIAAGRDSLAGRVTTLDLGSLLLREIAEMRWGHSQPPRWPANGQGDLTSQEFWREGVAQAGASKEIRLRSFEAFSRLGAYPIAHQTPEPSWPELSDYLAETVIRRVLEHDLPWLRKARRADKALLEEVFRLSCRYAGQSPGPSVFVPDLRTILRKDYSWQRVRGVLRALDATLLLRLIEPLELRLKRRTAPAKICLCDHALRAAWLQEEIPLDVEGLAKSPHLSDLAGRIAESVLGYFLASIPNLDVAYHPARGSEPEVDFVITIGTRRIPVEVKYRKRVDPFEDTRGLRAFLEKTVYNAPLGLLVTLQDGVTVPDPRIIPISLSSLLWMR
ncbi:MAG: ATP-binding protein [Deltaproteobacteria bacterium]|nr:ATP-binding protein [Deltaproteobacteria bacterium]